MPSPRKMPKNKEQFGIIIHSYIHDRAKQLSGLIPGVKRISDVYAYGVNMAWDAYHGKKASKTPLEESVDSIISGLNSEQLRFVEAFSRFMKNEPNSVNMDVIKVLLRQYIDENAATSNEPLEKRA